MAKARKKKKAMIKKLVKTLAWSWQKLLTLLSIPKTPPQLYPSLEEIIDCTCARPILIPPPTLQTKILEKFHHFGVLFFSPLSLFLLKPQTFSPKGPKKSLKILLNSPQFPAFFPWKTQVFCIKMKIVKEKKNRVEENEQKATWLDTWKKLNYKFVLVYSRYYLSLHTIHIVLCIIMTWSHPRRPPIFCP